MPPRRTTHTTRKRRSTRSGRDEHARPNSKQENDARRHDLRGASANKQMQAAQTHGRKPRVSADVRRLLEGIGTPETTSVFTPDPFQTEALDLIERCDVLVTAPTGSGKTWIAREEMRRLLEQGKRAWYTTPLKALTNSKYTEFREAFGAENVGILTGDRKENSAAPLIVGTTEIYRNQLFDSLRQGTQVDVDLVVLDEAHYLADEERGHVWEEAIILTPPRIRLLLLSATVGRAAEFARWIEEVRDAPVQIITRHLAVEDADERHNTEQRNARPVPLRAAFLHADGELATLTNANGEFNAEIVKRLQNSAANAPRAAYQRPHHQRRERGEEMSPQMLRDSLAVYNLLPAICFLPTRRRCDQAAADAAQSTRATMNLSPEAVKNRREIVRSFTEQHTEIKNHRHIEMIVRNAVAAHHAGHLPAWKLVVEKLMSAGLLDVIFATATVAAGVDFPARTVVLAGTQVRTGAGWRDLNATEFQQMTGRAGRRGRDNVGFIVAAEGSHQNPRKVLDLLRAEPEPLESQFRATYTTLLNLLDAYGSFAPVREIVERSFARRAATHRLNKIARERMHIEARIVEALAGKYAGVPDATSAINAARALERLASARAQLQSRAPLTRGELFLRWLDEAIKPGRVVGLGRDGKRLIFVTERRGANFVGVRADGERASVRLDRVGNVYENIYPTKERDIIRAFDETFDRRNPRMNEPRLRDAQAEETDAVNLLHDLIERVTTDACGAMQMSVELNGDAKEKQASVATTSQTACAESLWGVMESAATLERFARQETSLRDEAWQPFAKRARVLERFGYIDLKNEKVTERGRWLADLRLDRSLLVGEFLHRGLFANLDAGRVAGLVAAFVADAERNYGELELDDKLLQAIARFERVASEVASVEWEQGLEPAAELNLSAAATAVWWARGAQWSKLVERTRAEEGDLFRVLARTGEALMQIASLRESHAEAAALAHAAAEMVLREPVRSNELL